MSWIKNRTMIVQMNKKMNKKMTIMKKRNKYNRLKTPLVQLAMNYNKMMKKKIYLNSKYIWYNVEGLIFKSTNIMNYQG